MQLNVTTDYAIRTVLYLGQCKKIASATEISNEMGIPRGYLEKVLSKLKKAEYISADLGARGGYRLNKTLKDITLGDVIRLMESTTKINRCLEDDAYCSRKAVDFVRCEDITQSSGKIRDPIFQYFIERNFWNKREREKRQ